MGDQSVAGAAVARAWQVYRMINSGIDEHDERQATLDRFIRKQCAAGIEDTEMLVVEGLKYLKKLDQSGSD